MRDILVITISCLALLVALYGIWERRSVAHRQYVVRLSELIDEINQLNLDQDHAAETELDDAGRNAAFNQRREMLCREAMRFIEWLEPQPEWFWRLVPRQWLHPTVTDTQHRSLGHALAQVGDGPNALRHLEQAIGVAPPLSLSRMFALRGHAAFLCRSGAPDRGKASYDAALEIAQSLDGDDRHFAVGETHLYWARQLFHAGTQPWELLQSVDDEFARISHTGRRERAMHQLNRTRLELLAQAHRSLTETRKSTGSPSSHTSPR